MKKKTIIIVIVYTILGFIQSCDLHYCENVDYYDFSNIKINVINPNVELGDSLNIQLEPLNLDWMAKNQFKFEVIQTATALDCKEGYSGMKNPLTKIEITSDSDFSDDYPANTILNDLVTIVLNTADDYYGSNYEYIKLNNIVLDKFMNPQNQYMANLTIVERPIKEKEHILTIKLYKSNGEIMTAVSNKIVWK
jgi:hypothetical protein